MSVLSQTPEYKKAWTLDRTLGRPRTVPAAPVLERIADLTAAGWSEELIARAAGLDSSAVRKMRCEGRARVLLATARAILVLTPAQLLAAAGPSQWVPSVGMLRRIEALMALGWTHEQLTARGGVQTASLLYHRMPQCQRATHDAVAAVFVELCMTPGPSERTRRRAARSGYAPPLAWDDIDDPSEEPQGTPVTRLSPDAGAAMDEWVHLVRSGGLSHEDAYARLDTNRQAIERAAYRHARGDVLDLIYPARRAAS